MKLELFNPNSLIFLLLVAAISTGVFAADPPKDAPKRKSGLWETTMQAQGMPNIEPMQQCVDQASDDIMRQRASQQKPDCSVMEIKPIAGKVSIHSVCKTDGTTATTDAVFTGSFDASYKGEIVTRFNPPMRGMSETKVNLESSWKGACKPGQKPGEIIMPKMDMDAIMKDPKMIELMKRQK